jgi:phage shock protein PspC (stress-responsive transcriptional regulator)
MSETTDTAIPLDEAPARRLTRVDEGRWLGGVSAGLGRYFDINPLVYRVAFAALALAGGTGILLYAAAWLVIPHETQEDSIATEALRGRRDQPWLLLGIGLLTVGGLLVFAQADLWPDEGTFWLGAILVGAALVWWQVAGRESTRTEAPVADVAVDGGDDAPTVPGRPAAPPPPPPPPRPRRPSLFLPVLGGLLAGAGFFGLLAVTDVYDVSLAVAFAVALAVVGGAIAVGASTDKRVGGLVILGLVLLAGFAAAAASPVSLASGLGDKVARPLAASELEDQYDLGIGDLTVDLRDLTLPPGRTHVEADLGIGQLLVQVPEGVALDVDGHVGVGEVTVLGQEEDGTGADQRLFFPGPTPDAPVLELEADVGIGDLEVVRG